MERALAAGDGEGVGSATVGLWLASPVRISRAGEVDPSGLLRREDRERINKLIYSLESQVRNGDRDDEPEDEPDAERSRGR